ncbi:MAG: ATP-binding protein [Acidimicrobiia bacterium]
MKSIVRTWRTHPIWGRRAAVGALILLASLAIGTIVFPSAAEFIGPIGLLIGAGAAGLTLIIGARHLETRERLSWMLVGVGLLLISAGVVAFAVASSITQLSAFGPPDLFLLAGYAVGIVGFALLPQMASDWSQRVRAILDALIGAVSIGVISWLLVLDQLLGRMQEFSAWDRWAGSAYPILDVFAMVAIVVVFLRRSSYRFDVRLWLAALAFVAQSIADVGYLSSGVGRSFEQAQPLFVLNIVALMLFFVTGWFVGAQPERREYADRRVSIAALFAPYALGVTMTAILVVKTLAHQVDSNFWVLLYGTLIVSGLAIARQAVSIRENRIVVERERAALVSSISHELRTPLTAIVGFLDLLVDPGVISLEEREDLLRVVHQQAGYMARIVSDLVLLARGNLESVDLSPTRVELQQLVIAALAGVDKAGASVTMEVEPDTTVYVDSERIQQMIVNLASNAIRYGGGRVDIVARTDNGTVVVEVHDDGPGVPTKYEFTIWERFERGAHRLDAARPGSGIGLAIVRAVAKAHGGTTGYSRSERLGGACFSVVLPRRATDDHREPAASGVRPA